MHIVYTAFGLMSWAVNLISNNEWNGQSNGFSAQLVVSYFSFCSDF